MCKGMLGEPRAQNVVSKPPVQLLNLQMDQSSFRVVLQSIAWKPFHRQSDDLKTLEAKSMKPSVKQS